MAGGPGRFKIEGTAFHISSRTGGKLLVKRVARLLVFGLVLCVPGAYAQSGPEAGGHELEVWTGGGHGVNLSSSNTGIWNVGGRYGWVLTDLVGPSFLRGRFEYAVDVVPVFLVFQRTGTAYGFGLNPFELKWLFDTHRRAAPYVSVSGGTLFTNQDVPPGNSSINFTTSAALGVYFLRSKCHWSAEVLFMHISNAGLENRNLGVNTVQVRIGLGRFTHPR